MRMDITTPYIVHICTKYISFINLLRKETFYEIKCFNFGPVRILFSILKSVSISYFSQSFYT